MIIKANSGQITFKTFKTFKTTTTHHKFSVFLDGLLVSFLILFLIYFFVF